MVESRESSLAKHEIGRLRSLALHREVARRIGERPELVELARYRVARWLKDRSVSAAYATAWSEILSGSASDIAVEIVAETEPMDALRQTSPFAGVVDPRTRWRILKELRGH